MTRTWRFTALVCLSVVAGIAQEQVNHDSLLIADFTQRVADYVKLHKTVRSEIHGLKPTTSAGKIEEYQHRLAHRIREERSGVTQGNIFTREIAAEFRRLIGIAMHVPAAGRIRESMQHAAPVKINVRVNYAYPTGVPLQSTPPSLLMNLPTLPQEVEYRVVGNDLVLRDVDANLIVDYISGAIVP